MVGYKLIQELETLPYFNQLLKSGIIPINWLDYKVIYEFYLEEFKMQLEKGESKARARRIAKTIAADEFDIGERSVYRLVQKMESTFSQ